VLAARHFGEKPQVSGQVADAAMNLDAVANGVASEHPHAAFGRV
jgi:hypothetical protein